MTLHGAVVCVNTGSGHGLLPNDTKLLPEPVLSYHDHSGFENSTLCTKWFLHQVNATGAVIVHQTNAGGVSILH